MARQKVYNIIAQYDNHTAFIDSQHYTKRSLKKALRKLDSDPNLSDWIFWIEKGDLNEQEG